MFQMPKVTIDSIQNGKHQFIKKYMHDPELALAWKIYVDEQTKFCHTVVETMDVSMRNATKRLMETKVEKLFNPFGIDWYKAGWDAYVNQNTARDQAEKTSKH